MPLLLNQLDLPKCPFCGVDRPALNTRVNVNVATTSYTGDNSRHWKFYVCTRCGGVVTAASRSSQGDVIEMYPAARSSSETIPQTAKNYLDQALSTIHAPAGSVMLSASSVDAMLKSKGYEQGSLYARINQAVADHLITAEMAQWAHDVRLDANDQRHADGNAALPTEADAQKSVDFVMALAEFLFVLPARVQRGLAQAHQATS